MVTDKHQVQIALQQWTDFDWTQGIGFISF